jgi:hypothetical protein
MSVGNDHAIVVQSVLRKRRSTVMSSLRIDFHFSRYLCRTYYSPFCMSSTIAKRRMTNVIHCVEGMGKRDGVLMMLSQCFRAVSKPCLKCCLNSFHGWESTPPKRSTYSNGSLNGAASNPRLPPGEDSRMKPKSMWMIWPSRSRSKFPL